MKWMLTVQAIRLPFRYGCKTRWLAFMLSLPFSQQTIAAVYQQTTDKNRHFVCYSYISKPLEDAFSRYYVYHYHGCQLQTKPCHDKKAPHTFAKFKYAQQGLNAYYRCKLS